MKQANVWSRELLELGVLLLLLNNSKDAVLDVTIN